MSLAPSSTIAHSHRPERPVVTGEAVLGRVAGNAGIDDVDARALCPQRRLELVGKALPGRQTEARGQAVPQNDELQRLAPKPASAPCREEAAAKASAWTIVRQ